MSRAYHRLALFAVAPLYERRFGCTMSRACYRLAEAASRQAGCATPFALLLAALLLLAPNARGQVATGTPPYGSFTGGPDVIDLANLNVRISIPVIQKAGRGMPFSYAIGYDSSVWYPDWGVWVPVSNWGWRSFTAGYAGYASYTQREDTCQDSNGVVYHFTFYNDWYYYDADGSPHYIGGAVGESVPCQGTPPQQMTRSATDGSGYTMTFAYPPSATVYPRSGGSILAPLLTPTGSATVKDRNGNKITTDGSNFYDTLSATTPVLTITGSAPSPTTFTYTSGAGGHSYFTVYYTLKTIETHFGCSGITDYGRSTQMTAYLVTSVSLPDNSSYTFNYEQTLAPNHTGAVTGRIASVQLPTGGTISYTYSGGSGTPTTNAITCADGTTATLKRYTPDTGTDYWQYDHSEDGSGWTTTVTAPTYNNQQDQTVISFQGIYETQRKVYEGSTTSGTLLETVDTCYNGATIPCTGTGVTLPISNRAIQVTLPNLSPSKISTTYNSYGLPTEVDEYGFGPTLVRKTLTAYDTSIGNYINDRPASVTVCTPSGTDAACNGTGTVKAQTSYGHDGHGNLLTEIRSTGSAPATISRTFGYGSYGVLTSATDFNNNPTNYSNFTCANNTAFPQTITSGGLTKWQTWDCNGAVVTSTTDANQQTTNLSYSDPFWRLTEGLLPAVNGNRGWTLTDYTSATERNSYVGLTDTTPSTGCTGCRHDQVTLDGLGRVTTRLLMNDPQGADYVDTGYDSLGRVLSVTNPHRTGQNSGSDTYGYDALGRVTSITHADNDSLQLSYGGASQLCASGTYGLGYPTTSTDEAGKQRRIFTDALGRMIEVDEPNSSGALTLNTCYAYDPLDNLTQVVQGGQTRTFFYDSLSRLTSATNPESGTTQYSYDPNGNVVARTDANGTNTTYSYDQLNRLLSKIYSDGTPGASFSYDEASVTLNGTTYTLTYPKGRLTHTAAGTGNAYAPTLNTIASYDPMGRVQDYWATSYNVASLITLDTWHMNFSYDLAGNLTNWTHPAGFSLSNTISAAERITQISSSLSDSTHPSTLATGPSGAIQYTAWGALSKLTNGCAGSGCVQRQETYDYNNRLEPVRVQLGTSSNNSANYCLVYNYYASGVTNPPASCAVPSPGTGNDGNVMGLFYQDSVNSSLSHTAAYSYDALNRLAGATAKTLGQSTLWSQTYSYDRWGNMSCAGSGLCTAMSYDPHMNNRLSSIGGQAVSYDAAGNLTSDGTGVGTHTYQWDAEGRLRSVDNGAAFSYAY